MDQFVNFYVDVLKRYNVFSGRASRGEYWTFVLVNFILSMVVNTIAGALRLPVVASLFSLVVLVPSIAIAIRRMHDVNKSGWFLLIPVYNFILAIQKGDVAANTYGEPSATVVPTFSQSKSTTKTA